MGCSITSPAGGCSVGLTCSCRDASPVSWCPPPSPQSPARRWRAACRFPGPASDRQTRSAAGLWQNRPERVTWGQTQWAGSHHGWIYSKAMSGSQVRMGRLWYNTSILQTDDIHTVLVADPEGAMGPWPHPWASKGPFLLPKESLECPKEWSVSFNKYFGALWKDSLTSWGTLWASEEGPLSSPNGPSELIVGPLSVWSLKWPSLALKSRGGPSQLEGPPEPGGPLWQVGPSLGQILDPPLHGPCLSAGLHSPTTCTNVQWSDFSVYSVPISPGPCLLTVYYSPGT